MLRITGRRQKRQSTGLSDIVSEVLAAWILAVLALGAGLSLLAFHERGVRDGVIVPGWRASRVAGNEEWVDPECRRDVTSCLDLPEQGGSADPVHAPSVGAIGW